MCLLVIEITGNSIMNVLYSIVYTVAVCSVGCNVEMAYLRTGSNFYFKVCVYNPDGVQRTARPLGYRWRRHAEALNLQ